jgi:hypothetical protein
VLEYANDWTAETATSYNLKTGGASYTDRFGVVWTLAGMANPSTWTITPATGIRQIMTGATIDASMQANYTDLVAVGDGPVFDKILDNLWIVHRLESISLVNSSALYTFENLASGYTISHARLTFGTQQRRLDQYDDSGVQSATVSDSGTDYYFGHQVGVSSVGVHQANGASPATPADIVKAFTAEFFTPDKSFNVTTNDPVNTPYTLIKGISFGGAISFNWMSTKVYRWRAEISALKLSAYAKTVGVSYQTALRMFQKGQVPGAYRLPTGTIIVPDDVCASSLTISDLADLVSRHLSQISGKQIDPQDVRRILSVLADVV